MIPPSLCIAGPRRQAQSLRRGQPESAVSGDEASRPRRKAVADTAWGAGCVRGSTGLHPGPSHPSPRASRSVLMAAYQYIYVMKGLSKIYPGGKEILKDVW